MFGGSHRKDAVFYDGFKDQARVAVEAAGAFGALLDDLALGESAVRDIDQAKKRSADITRHIVRELHKTWITPLDRHQIHQLAHCIEGVTSLLGRAAARVVLFRIRDLRAEVGELARDVKRGCELVRDATELLPELNNTNSGEVMRIAGEIHGVENRADETHRCALATLFDGATDPLTVMKWREILDDLEAATDVTEEAAELFEGIVLENA